MVQEKRVIVNDLEVHYKIAGQGQPILILHGWGRGSDSYSEVMELLGKEGYRVVVPDLPGFGKSTPPPSAWGVGEYVEFVNTCAAKLNLQRFVLLGHSFGGQIALQFAIAYPEKLERLILYAAAAIRRKPQLKQKVSRIIAKMGKTLFSLWPLSYSRSIVEKIFYKILGGRDYLYIQGIMKEVREKVIRDDLSRFFSQVRVSTLLLWGDKDTVTPVEDAYALKDQIPNVVLQVIRGASHRLHADMPAQFVNTIVNFCYSKK